MEYIEAPTPYLKPKKETEVKIIDSKNYELNLGENAYSLLMETDSEDKLHFKLNNPNKLSLTTYEKIYKYDEILNLLLLHKAQYEDLSKIFLFFDKAITNNKLNLSYNENNKKMFLKLKRQTDFEEFECNLELNEMKLTNEEMFKMLINEINVIKLNKKEKEDNNNSEIINDLMNKNKENETYIKDLENKILKLENIINDLEKKIILNTNNIKNNGEKINNSMNNLKNNIEEDITNSINNIKKNLDEMIILNINYINNIKNEIEKKIIVNSDSINNIKNNLEEKIISNTNSINDIKKEIEKKMNDNIKNEKINEIMKKMNYNTLTRQEFELLQKYLLSMDKTVVSSDFMNPNNNLGINNLNLNNMNNQNKNNMNMNNINMNNFNLKNMNNLFSCFLSVFFLFFCHLPDYCHICDIFVSYVKFRA